MSSKGARLRAKRARQDDMGLAAIPRRKRQGRARMPKLRDPDAEDESLQAIRMRCSRAGLPPTEGNMRIMRDQWKGCQAGMTIDRLTSSHDEKVKLWGAVQHIRATYAAVCRAEGIPAPHATCLRILLPVDAMHADASSPARDLRSEEERLEAARTAWARVEGWMGRFGRHSASLTRRCVIEDTSCESAAAMFLVLDNVVKGLEGR